MTTDSDLRRSIRQLRCVDSHARTDTGRVRDHNEDACVTDPERGIFVLADGMGGHAGGEVAATTACVSAHKALATNSVIEGRVDSAMRAAFAAADRSVRSRAARDPSLVGMGTTLVVAWGFLGRLWIGHAGDSRAYLWRDGRLSCLTQDHGHGHIVTRAVGIGSQTIPDTSSIPLMKGNILLLCSDGLSKPLSDTSIARVFASGRRTCSKISADLVDSALAAGGPDNVTVAVARFG
jgi:protein phosphatase